MGIYSSYVKDLVRRYVQNPSLPMTQQIDLSLPHFFNFDYPIWAESYRPILERKIIMKYFSSEICCESVGEWKIYLEQKLNEIMPYYNELYLTTSKKYDWLEDVNTLETYEGNKTATGKVLGKIDNTSIQNDNTINNESQNNIITGKDNTKGKTLKSDFPQANFAGSDYGTNLDEIENEQTTTGTTTNDRKSATTGESNLVGKTSSDTDTTNKEDDIYTRVRKGLSGARSLTQLNVEYRNSLINIDKMIVDELKDLFMMLWR